MNRQTEADPNAGRHFQTWHFQTDQVGEQRERHDGDEHTKVRDEVADLEGGINFGRGGAWGWMGIFICYSFIPPWNEGIFFQIFQNFQGSFILTESHWFLFRWTLLWLVI